MSPGQPHTGRVVPAYALTRGRTQSVGGDLPLETLVTATEFGLQWVGSLQVERREIVQRSTVPISVAELAAHLHIPLGTARVLVGDLASSGHLTIHRPLRTVDTRPDRVILERLLDGLRSR
jgi:ABC-type taurine transport system ATPase subunit